MPTPLTNLLGVTSSRLIRREKSRSEVREKRVRCHAIEPCAGDKLFMTFSIFFPMSYEDASSFAEPLFLVENLIEFLNFSSHLSQYIITNIERNMHSRHLGCFLVGEEFDFERFSNCLKNLSYEIGAFIDIN